MNNTSDTNKTKGNGLKKKLVLLALIVFIAVAVIGGLRYYDIKTRNAVEELAAEKKMINILLAGSNNYQKRKFDFFAILSINPDNNNIGVTFIPPSFRVNMNARGNDPKRIDEVDFIYFDRLRASFNRDLNIPIQFYIQLYASETGRIVDLLEGIDIFYLDQYGCDVFMKPGLNYLDGEKIMRYINTVEENSIYLKYDRIMDILLTLYYNRSNKLGFLNMDFIAAAIESNFTNLLPKELLSLSKFLADEGELIYTILPGAFENDYYITDDIAYKIYEKDFLGKLVMGAEDEAIPKIKILNATDISGLARKVRNTLNMEGYNVVEFSTSPYGKMNKSVIISKKGDSAFVKQISELTGIPTVYYIIDNSLLYNTLIILGEDMANGEYAQ